MSERSERTRQHGCLPGGGAVGASPSPAATPGGTPEGMAHR